MFLCMNTHPAWTWFRRNCEMVNCAFYPHLWAILIKINYNNTFFLNNTYSLQTNTTSVLCFAKYEQDRNGRKTMASVFLTTGLIVSNSIWEQLLKFRHNRRHFQTHTHMHAHTLTHTRAHIHPHTHAHTNPSLVPGWCEKVGEKKIKERKWIRETESDEVEHGLHASRSGAGCYSTPCNAINVTISAWHAWQRQHADRSRIPKFILKVYAYIKVSNSYKIINM